MTAERIGFETPEGSARVVVHRARRERLTLLLTHGAGAGIDTPDLLALAKRLPEQGFSVIRFEQPWVAAGRRVAPAPAVLDRGLRAAAVWTRAQGMVAGRGSALVLGGRSAGARSAVRCAGELSARGCLALAFPLHPPGRPERSRVDELLGCGVPVQIIQGARDSMGRPEEFPEQTAVSVVPEADHSLRVPKRAALNQDQALELVVAAAVAWLSSIR